MTNPSSSPRRVVAAAATILSVVAAIIGGWFVWNWYGPAAQYGDLFQQAQLSGQTWVAAPLETENKTVTISIKIDRNGNVLWAYLTEPQPRAIADPVLRAAYQMRFRPKIVRGRAVNAIGYLNLNVFPNSYNPRFGIQTAPLSPKRDFPTGPLQETEIRLQRTECYGPCPVYDVTILGDGRVRYHAKGDIWNETNEPVHFGFEGSGVLLTGTFYAQVSTQAVAALVAQFRDADFFHLQMAYEGGGTDGSTYLLTIKVGGEEKLVYDYFGRVAGMPPAVTVLQDAVDRVAGTNRWINGNADTIKVLKAQHFDFHSQRAAQMMERAMYLSTRQWPGDTLDLLNGALDEGLDPHWNVLTSSREGERIRVPIGVLIGLFAVAYDDEVTFDRMVDAGMLNLMDQEQKDVALCRVSDRNGHIALVLMAHGANPNFESVEYACANLPN